MKPNKQYGILYGLLIWVICLVFFKILLNGLLFISTFFYLAYKAIRKRDFQIFNKGVGTMLYRGGVCYDIEGSVYGGELLNDVMLKDPKHPPVNGVPVLYGGKETISFYTGVNAIIGNLDEDGSRLREILKKVLGMNHSVDSVPSYIKKLLG